MAWKLKSCPRCGGDTYIDKDEYNTWYEQCLQCGYWSELKRVELKPEPALPWKGKETRQAKPR